MKKNVETVFKTQPRAPKNDSSLGFAGLSLPRGPFQEKNPMTRNHRSAHML